MNHSYTNLQQIVYFAPQFQSANKNYLQSSQYQMNGNTFQSKVTETHAFSNKLAFNASQY